MQKNLFSCQESNPDSSVGKPDEECPFAALSA
jgi:hypothetical protein